MARRAKGFKLEAGESLAQEISDLRSEIDDALEQVDIDTDTDDDTDDTDPRNHDADAPGYSLINLPALWAGTKLTVLGAILGAVGGGLFGWNYPGPEAEVIDRFANAFVFGFVGIPLTLGFLSSVLLLQTIASIVRASLIVGLPLAVIEVGGTGWIVIWLGRMGAWEYLSSAPAIVVAFIVTFGGVAFVCVTFVLVLIATGLVVASDRKRRRKQ